MRPFQIFLCCILTFSKIVQADPMDSLRLELRNGSKYIIHRVSKGETLAALATRYSCEEARILRANPLVTDAIYSGQILRIPLNETRYGIQTISPVVPLSGPRFPVNKEPVPINPVPKPVLEPETAPQTKQPPATPNPDYKVYVVASPQTVWHLAESFGVEPGDIIALNNLKNYKLKEGQRVKIPLSSLALVPEKKPEPLVQKKPEPVTPPKVEPKPLPVEGNRRVVVTPPKDSIRVVAKVSPVPIKPKPTIVTPAKLNADSLAMAAIKKQRRIESLSSMDQEYHSEKGIAYKVFDYSEPDQITDPYTAQLAEANAISVTSIYPNKGVGKKSQTHVVKQSETLHGIANQYKVSVSDLINWNGMEKYQVRVGQELSINSERALESPYERSLAKQKNLNGMEVMESSIKGLGIYNPANKQVGVYVNNISPGKFVYLRNLENFEEHYSQVLGPLPKGLPSGTVILLDADCAKNLDMDQSLTHIELLVSLVKSGSTSGQK